MPIRNPPRPQKTNAAGHPYLYPCEHCGRDFGGTEMLRRHRKGRSPNKVCRSVEEMKQLGWWEDPFGRWRQRHGHAR